MAQTKVRRALGRGLSNLIPVAPEGQEKDNEVFYVAVEAITENPFQPRRDFDDEEIKHLAESIEAQGLLQPVVLRKAGSGYQIISGERRFRALKHLGKDKIPSIVKADVSDVEMLEMALVENIQRENLNDIDVALSYQKLLFDCGLSHQQLSERVGKSRSVITNTLRLLKLPENIGEMVRTRKISSGHARALLSVKSEKEQLTLAEKIVDLNLSVREIEKLSQSEVKKEKKKVAKKSTINRERSLDPDLLHQEERMRYHFGTDVKINTKGNAKGSIEISYYSQEDLNRILEMLVK